MIELVGAFESTFQPGHDADVAESTGHVDRRMADLMLLQTCGVQRLRYPVRWHRLEAEQGHFDWSETDEVLHTIRDHGWRPIVDLVHHTSYPRWLTNGFADERFPDAYLRYVEAFGERYPWVQQYTLFNEPLSTLFLCAHEGVWPPYHRGTESFVRLLQHVLPAVHRAAHAYRVHLPAAEHVWTDTCERHTGSGRDGRRYAAYANDRRFVALDAMTGRVDSLKDRPFMQQVAELGGADLFEMDPVDVDVVGLDYYAHCQWHFGPHEGSAPTPVPPPLAALIHEYADRYRRPVMLTETNLRGFAGDRTTWFKYTLEQCELAAAHGVDVRGYCWFPFVDSCDWDSLLFRCDRSIDPVGVFSLGPDLQRHPSTMSVAYARVGHGGTSADIPAYRLQYPVSEWLRGWKDQMRHYDWQDPPYFELLGAQPADPQYRPLHISDAPSRVA